MNIFDEKLSIKLQDTKDQLHPSLLQEKSLKKEVSQVLVGIFVFLNIFEKRGLY
jgi:hypothetical protein